MLALIDVSATERRELALWRNTSRLDAENIWHDFYRSLVKKDFGPTQRSLQPMTQLR